MPTREEEEAARCSLSLLASISAYIYIQPHTAHSDHAKKTKSDYNQNLLKPPPACRRMTARTQLRRAADARGANMGAKRPERPLPHFHSPASLVPRAPLVVHV